MSSLCVDIPNLALLDRASKPVDTMGYAVRNVKRIKRFASSTWSVKHANATNLQSVPNQVFNIWQCVNVVLCKPNDNPLAVFTNLETRIREFPWFPCSFNG